jgi:hypothetical protein
MTWGLWRLFSDQPTNVLAGHTGRTGVVFVAASLIIPGLLAAAVPREALAEERVFRAGNDRRPVPARALRVVGFGAVHLLVGVPVAAAVALMVLGVYQDLVYQSGCRQQRRRIAAAEVTTGGAFLSVRVADYVASEGGTYRAAAAHAVYNWVALSVLIVVVLAGVLL